MSTPLVTVNSNLIINLFQVTHVTRTPLGEVSVNFSSGRNITLDAEDAERFMGYAREAADNIPQPTPPAEERPSEARDFGAILDDPNPPPAEPPTSNG